jgi:hypothetical protein
MAIIDCKHVQLLGLDVSFYFVLYKFYMSEYLYKIVQTVNGSRLSKLQWQLLMTVCSYIFLVYSINYLITTWKIIQTM